MSLAFSNRSNTVILCKYLCQNLLKNKFQNEPQNELLKIILLHFIIELDWFENANTQIHLKYSHLINDLNIK